MVKSVYHLFQRCAIAQPDHPAIISQSESISYHDLESAILTLADDLLLKGVGPTTKVPILSTRSIDALISFLAVLATGACYVPLDLENWSEKRIMSILDRLGAKTVIDTRSYSDLLGRDGVIATKSIREGNDKRPSPSHKQPSRVHAEEAAYMIFTSGTTGAPKGVMVSHASLLHYVQQGEHAAPFNMGVEPEDVVLLILSVAFDAFTCIAMSTLCNGGTLLLSDPSAFIEDVESCSILPVTPSLLRTLPSTKSYPRVRTIFLGGEPPGSDLVKRWSTDHCRLFNGYGTTETTCTSLMAELLPSKPISLGIPIPGCMAHVLDNNLEECCSGELAISGRGLAIGYFDDARQTEERFIQWRGKRLYLTGDYVRKENDSLIFVGRKDGMVKNRNFLIHPQGQVVPELRRYPGVVDAIAFVHDGLLMAAVTPKSLDSGTLRKTLSRVLDSYLVPDVIRAIDMLPLNANGKVDITALKSSIWFEVEQNNCQIPQNAIDAPFAALKASVSYVLDIPIGRVSGTTSFWEIGGNSFVAIKVRSDLYNRGWTLTQKDMFTMPNLYDISRTMQALVVAKDFPPKALSSRDVTLWEEPKTTPSQLQMLRSTLYNPVANYMLAFFDFECPANGSGIIPLSLETAWRKLIERHSIFRYGFDMSNGRAVNQPSPSFIWRYSYIVDEDPEAAKKSIEGTMLGGLTRSDNTEIFVPQNVFHLLVFPSGGMFLTWLVHHAFVDGWSLGIMLSELEVILRGHALQPAPQFSHFTNHRRSELARNRSDSTKFWAQIMADQSSERSLTSALSYDTAAVACRAEAVRKARMTRTKLNLAARDSMTSVATILSASWAVLLSEYTSTDRVVFGTVFAGRVMPIPSADRVVGPLVNTCPFKIEVPIKGLKTRFLRQVQDDLLDVDAHQYTASECLGDGSGSAFAGLFDTVLAVELDLPESTRSTSISDLCVKITRKDFPEFPITIYVDQEENHIVYRLLSSEGKATAALGGVLEHFENIVEALVSEEIRDIEDVRQAMMKSSEHSLLVAKTTHVQDNLPRLHNLRCAFEQAVDQWPELIAAEFRSTQLKYVQLEGLANHVAHELRPLVQNGSVVTVLSDGSLEWLVAVLAVIKVGAVYAPVDIKLPAQRVRYMLTKSRSKLCLIPNENCEIGLPDGEIDMIRMKMENGSGAPRLPIVIDGNDPAYLIFTSGSTGEPKPVQVKHRAVCSYLSNSEGRLHARPHRRHAQMFSVGFDVSVAEVFGTLCFGATLVLKDLDDPLNHLNKVNATMATPSLAKTLSPNDFPNLDTVLLAGETVPQFLADRWSGHVDLYNGYGPCECTIISSVAKLDPGKTVTIGKPICSTKIYILNSSRRPVPIGVKGEICISGIQVVDGYLNLPEATARNFVPDPFDSNATMYCTGDIGAWNDDMEILFFGRNDHQVKVGGYRVELEEVERAMLTVETTLSTVVALPSEDGVIAIVCPALSDTTRFRKRLATILPHYALPSRILQRQWMPTTSNQKLDREALKLWVTRLHVHELAAPLPACMTATQRSVASIWKDVLMPPNEMEVHIASDFTELGGNSLRQMRVVQRLSAVFGQRIPLRLLMQHQTVGELGNAIDGYLASNSSHGKAVLSTKTILPASSNPNPPHLRSVEREMLQSYWQSTTKCAFNIVLKLEILGEVELDPLRDAMNNVLASHDIFRTFHYHDKESSWRKLSMKAPGTTHLPFEKSGTTDLVAGLQQPFQLDREFPAQGYLIDETWRAWMILKMHHAVVDKTSLKLVLQEISSEYARLTLRGVKDEKLLHSLSPEPALDGDWIQEGCVQPVDLEENDVRFWKEFLRPLPSLPFSKSGASFVPGQGAHVSLSLPYKAQTKYQSTFETYLACVAIAVSAATGFDDLIIAASYEDRSQPGTETQIGVFLDRLPIRIRVPDRTPAGFTMLKETIRDDIEEALAHAIPYAHISKMYGTLQLFDVMVTYHREEDMVARHLQLPGATVKEDFVRMPGARFPLLVEIHEVSGQLTFYLEYSTQLVSPACLDSIQAALLNVFT